MSAADEELPGNADGGGQAERVEDEELGVGKRRADGGQTRPGGRRALHAERGDDVSLGGAVLILQDAARKLLEERDERGSDLELLTRRHDFAQRRRNGGAVRDGIRERLESDEGQEEPLDALLVHEVEQRRNVLAQSTRGQHEGAAGPPGGEELLAGDVEAERGELEGGGRRLRGLTQLPGEQVAQRAVRKGDALGPAGGAGGVDDVGGRLGRQRQLRRVRRLSGEGIRLRVDEDEPRRGLRGQRSAEAGVREDDGR